ncbi:hypothetical protein RQP46_009732 [Phenoliferia psychrophenolica]
MHLITRAALVAAAFFLGVANAVDDPDGSSHSELCSSSPAELSQQEHDYAKQLECNGDYRQTNRQLKDAIYDSPTPPTAAAAFDLYCTNRTFPNGYTSPPGYYERCKIHRNHIPNDDDQQGYEACLASA